VSSTKLREGSQRPDGLQGARDVASWRSARPRWAQNFWGRCHHHLRLTSSPRRQWLPKLHFAESAVYYWTARSQLSAHRDGRCVHFPASVDKAFRERVVKSSRLRSRSQTLDAVGQFEVTILACVCALITAVRTWRSFGRSRGTPQVYPAQRTPRRRTDTPRQHLGQPMYSRTPLRLSYPIEEAQCHGFAGSRVVATARCTISTPSSNADVRRLE
jgi:hypothetical protein